MNIVDYITTPGNFVFVPTAGKTGCVRAFDPRTNEVEVSFAAVGLMEALANKTGEREQFLADMRDRNVFRTYHFMKLCVGRDPNEG